MEISAVLEHRIGEIKKTKTEQRFEVQRRKVKRSFSFFGLFTYISYNVTKGKGHFCGVGSESFIVQKEEHEHHV